MIKWLICHCTLMYIYVCDMCLLHYVFAGCRRLIDVFAKPRAANILVITVDYVIDLTS